MGNDDCIDPILTNSSNLLSEVVATGTNSAENACQNDATFEENGAPMRSVAATENLVGSPSGSASLTASGPTGLASGSAPRQAAASPMRTPASPPSRVATRRSAVVSSLVDAPHQSALGA